MYAIKQSLYLSVSAIILCGGGGSVANNDITQNTHAIHISALASTPSYQIASIAWLPDALEKGLKFSGFNSSGGDGTGGGSGKADEGHGKGDGCDSRYNLSECPDKGKCDRCAFANKYYLKGCDNGYKISGNSCSAANCSVLNASYLTTIPANQICTKVTEGGLTCYKDCRNVSCGDYKVSCDNIANTTNVTSSSACPDCQSTDANCTQKLCKITGCNSGYKVNSDGSACVEPDDTCPSGYYKSCSDGTEGSPEYTEKGTACYKCKKKEYCSSSYKYNSSNCPTATHSLCSTSCGGKYSKCIVKPYPVPSGSDKTFKHCGLDYTTNSDLSNCPDYSSNSDLYKFSNFKSNLFYTIPYISGTGSNNGYPCYNGDRACIDAYMKFNNDKNITLDKDINCGILGWVINNGGTYTLNGNGHTITFDSPEVNGFYLHSDSNAATLNINNAKIIAKNSNSSEFASDTCWEVNHTLFANPGRGSNTINLTNVDVDILGNNDASMYAANIYGTSNIKVKGSLIDHVDLQHVYGNVNLFISKDVKDKVDVLLAPHGDSVVNIMTEKNTDVTIVEGEGDFKVNVCFKSGGGISKSYGFDMSDSDLAKHVRSNAYYDWRTTIVPNICDEDIFSGSFWK